MGILYGGDHLLARQVLIPLTLISILHCASCNHAAPPPVVKTFDSGHRQIGDYEIWANGSMGDGTFKIAKAGKPVASGDGRSFQLDACDAELPPGKSLTGDGVPGLVISETTGGAHCCYAWRLFRLGRDRVEQLGVFDTQNSDVCPLADVNHDGIPELRLTDWTFAYWKASFADSPAFTVLYRLAQNRYVAAPELMRQAPMEPQALADKARAVEMDGDGSIPPALWSAMLELISSGRAAQVTEFLDQAWPGRRAGRAQFVKEFTEQLKRSDNWRLLEEVNGGGIRIR